jgi:predicted PurR-regulated permease PerM
MDRKTIEIIFFLSLVVASVILLFFIFKPYLAAIFVALIFAIIFFPVKNFLLEHSKIKNITSSFITVFIVLIIILAPLFILGVILFQEATDMIVRLPENGVITRCLESYLLTLEDYINSIAPDAQVSLSLTAYIEGIASWIVDNFGSLFSSIAHGTINLLLIIIALFFFLKDGEKIKEIVLKWSPLGDDHDRGILNKMAVAINSVVKGTLFIAALQGVLAGIGFAIFGVPSPVLWGFVTMLAALIPSVGTAIVIIPMVIYLYFTTSFVWAAGLLVWGLAIVGLVDNFLRPILIERGVKIHPFLILLSVFGGLNIFGPIGFLIGPIVLSFVVALIDVYPDVMSRTKNGDIPMNTEN